MLFLGPIGRHTVSDQKEPDKGQKRARVSVTIASGPMATHSDKSSENRKTGKSDISPHDSLCVGAAVSNCIFAASASGSDMRLDMP